MLFTLMEFILVISLISVNPVNCYNESIIIAIIVIATLLLINSILQFLSLNLLIRVLVY